MLLESETLTILEHSNQITIDCTVAVNTTFVDRRSVSEDRTRELKKDPCGKEASELPSARRLDSRFLI